MAETGAPGHFGPAPTTIDRGGDPMTSRAGAVSTSTPRPAALPRAPARAGQVISALSALFLLADGVLRAVAFAPYLDGTLRAGFDASVSAPIGALLVGCTLLYAVPATAVLGAVMLTGYLGAATATNLRIGDPFWFPLLFGVLIWAGIYLREPRLASLLPLRRD
jgi:hypothetical protein